jgi:hypothetical protein
MATPSAPRWSLVRKTLLLGIFLAGNIHPAEPTLAAENCRRVPSSIPRDGSRNVTRPLNRFLNRLPDGVCVRFPRRAKYRVEGTLRLRDKVGLTIYGRGSKIFATSIRGDLDPGPKRRWRQHLAITNSSDIEIRNLRIDGAAQSCRYNSEWEGEAGVNVNGSSSNIALHGLTIRGTGGDAVSVGPATGIRDVTVASLSADCLGRMGMSVSGGAENVTLRDSSFDRIGRSFFDIEPIPGRHVQNVDVLQNTVGDHHLNTLSCGGWGTNGDLTFQGNVNTINPIVVKCLSFGPVLFDGNTGVGQLGKPLGFKSLQVFLGQPNTMSVTVVGNVQHFGQNQAFLAALETNACSLYVISNDFTGADALWDGAPDERCTWTDGGGNPF